MKQVKRHNGFIYYTKYKSSWTTLILIKQKKRKKCFWTINRMNSLSPLSLLYRFSAFFPPKTGGRPKIAQHSFPARVASDEPHLWVVYLWLFAQVHPTPVQWDLSPLIAPTKTSVEGRAVPLCIYVPLAEFTSMLFVIILHE